MIPILHSFGVITPGQLGPIILDLEFLRASFLDCPGFVTPGRTNMLGIFASEQKFVTFVRSSLLALKLFISAKFLSSSELPNKWYKFAY